MLFRTSSCRLRLASTLFATSVVLSATLARGADRNRVLTPRARQVPGARVLQARVSSQAFTTKTVTVRMQDVETYMPPRVRGDREFGGHGPRVTIRARYYVRGDRVYRQLFMRAAETRITAGFLTSKPSVAEGWNTPRVVYVAPRGWAIRPFTRTDHRLPQYTDTDHAADVFDTPVGKAIVWGDGKGNDIGRITRVRVEWDSTVRFVVERHADVASPQVPQGKPEG